MLLGANLECDLRQALLFVSVSSGKLVKQQWWLEITGRPWGLPCVYRDQSVPGSPWGWTGVSFGPCLCFGKFSFALIHVSSALSLHDRAEHGMWNLGRGT